MLWLNPTEVTLGGRRLEQVRAISMDQRATRLAVEHSDLGPHAVFVDAAERRTTLRIVRTGSADGGFDGASIGLGEQASLSFRTAAGASDAGAGVVAATVVVVGVEHEWDDRRGGVQTIALEAVSMDGATAPVTRSEAE